MLQEASFLEGERYYTSRILYGLPPQKTTTQQGRPFALTIGVTHAQKGSRMDERSRIGVEYYTASIKLVGTCFTKVETRSNSRGGRGPPDFPYQSNPAIVATGHAAAIIDHMRPQRSYSRTGTPVHHDHSVPPSAERCLL